ncbi:GNAT family N-acetyltransferase [Usitatibacter palustris]|uniref:GNAT family N-acetyltransferase n=1 Tax=Usitatibacter palustris TaxID=2732487 RepID=UPI001BB148E1|nr:GNAT family N-acetyltransferase [Usitatibacter palustris]
MAFNDASVRLTLRAISELGQAPSSNGDALAVIEEVRRLYGRVGFQPPWICYLAFEGERCVGTCGFTSPPHDDRVEIAYYTFPEDEARGVATRMASELVEIARKSSRDLVITAHTLPRQGASTAVLRKLGFAHVATKEHPDDGMIWVWQLGDVLE